jgi:hypothetical protein
MAECNYKRGSDSSCITRQDTLTSSKNKPHVCNIARILYVYMQQLRGGSWVRSIQDCERFGYRQSFARRF